MRGGISRSPSKMPLRAASESTASLWIEMAVRYGLAFAASLGPLAGR